MGRLHRVLLLAACLLASAAAQDLLLENVNRRINLKNTWAKVIDTITAKNTAKKDVKEFVVCYPDSLASRISIVKVLINKQKQNVAPVEQAPAGTPAGVSCYKATLSTPLAKGKSVELDAVTTITGVYKPNPSEIRQGDKQYVEYVDNVYLLSPYVVDAQTTSVLLPTSDVKSYTNTEDDNTSRSGSKVTYGKFGRQEPWAVKELKVHFHHDKPLKRVNSLVREIEVSHWGNIYVEEKYEIQNAGSTHTGKFSRLQYAHSAGGKTNSFQQVYAHMPLSAHSTYYKDIIGNISSSDTITRSDNTELVINLRYPLMGGWKTDFVLGWSTPLEGFLYRRPKGKLRLLTDFSTSFDDLWVEDMTVRVVLPEGASNIKCTLPFGGVDQSWDKKFTYLDTAGRPVLVLKKTNVVPEHNKKFAVDYSFGFMGMIREPLLLISAFAAFFALVSVYNRLDFTITRDERWQEQQAADRARGILQQLADIWDDEGDLIDKLVDLARLVSNDASAELAHSRRLLLEANLRMKDAQAKPLLQQLENISAKAAAGARDHADKSKSLQQRAAKLLGDKVDLIKKGIAPHEASTKVAPATQQLLDAVKTWLTEGAKMAQQ